MGDGFLPLTHQRVQSMYAHQEREPEEGRGGEPEEGRGREGDNAERGLTVGRWELEAGDKGGQVMVI
jgi:hypothetical protein